MHAFRRWLPALPAALLALAGCSSAPGDETGTPIFKPPGELLTSDKQRVKTPGAPAEDVAALVTGNTGLAVALYQQSAQPGQNVCFSPFSITQALAMTYAGARGTTETQMAQALRFSLPQERLHPAMNALDLTLQGRSAGPEGKVPPPMLNVANDLWVQRGFAFEPAYLDVLAQHYGAGVHAMDFAHEPDTARTAINSYVETRTYGHVERLLPQDAVRPDTRLVLTNALYFRGAWATPFNGEGSTQVAPFHLLDGSEEPVAMMHGRAGYPRMQGEGFEALALPYAGGAFRMLLVVPDTGRFADIEARLSSSFLDGVRAALAPRDTALGLPRFEVQRTLPLSESLEALGMVDAFSDRADFSGMTQAEQLVITAAVHESFISVSEGGTEAGAATGVVAGPVSMPESFTVDRPFLFLIEDVETKAVLFLGRVVKP